MEEQAMTTIGLFLTEGPGKGKQQTSKPSKQGSHLKKPALEKTRVLLPGFIGFFQEKLEKTRKIRVFSRFHVMRYDNFTFYCKKRGILMQNCVFSLKL